MDRFFARLGGFVVRFRFLVVLGWVAVAVLASVTLPSLASEVNNNNVHFLPANAASERASELIAPIIGGTSDDSQIVVVAYRSDTALTGTDQAAIRREVRAVSAVPKVVSARLGGTSENGHASQILIEADATQMDQATQKTVVDDIAATFATAKPPGGLQFHLAGATADNVASTAGSNKTGGIVQLLSVALILVLLLIIFRSVLAPVVTLVPPVFALLISFRFVGGLGDHGIKISQITELLLIILLLGAGTDYGLFLVFRTREEIRRGLSARDSVTHALVRVGESISASAGTVIVALLTLLFASFGVYHDLGVPLAVGVGVMLLAGLTLLPALLAIFGRAVFWPSKVIAGPEKDGVWAVVAARLVRRPALTLGAGLVIFVGLAAFALGFHASGFGSSQAPRDSDAARGDAIIASQFPRSSANPANLVFVYQQPIWNNANPVATADNTLQSSRQLTDLNGPLNADSTTLSPKEFVALHRQLGSPFGLPAVQSGASKSVSNALYLAYRASTGYVSRSGTTIQFQASFTAGSQQSTAALKAVPTVRATVQSAARASGAVRYGLAGPAAGSYDVSSTSDHDLLVVFPIAILAIGILLALVLRSLVAPLYLIVSVALSYLAALGVATLIFIDIGGEGGIAFVLPFLMFIFLLALGEDYNILVMTRIREEAHHLPLRDAVALAVAKTGGTVTSAGVILAGTFGVLAITGGNAQIRDVGTGLAVGILMDTFLVRTLLVPATVVLLGRRNWWPSAMGRSAVSGHPDIDESLSLP